MRPLIAADVVAIWERGERQDSVERPLTILAAAFPDYEADALLDLSLGARNLCLLEVREALFGLDLPGVATCPNCQERLEFQMTTHSMRPEAPSGALREDRFQSGPWEARYRLPSSRDLAAARDCPDTEAARAMLLARCVLQLTRGGDATPVERLPNTIASELAAEVVAADPGAETLVDLSCPSCATCWTDPFDISTYLWVELRAQARRLLIEVHMLARVYGWREADILAMSAMRRQAYLELAT
jgi:hypothetical protein